jgi:hypothetical protein
MRKGTRTVSNEPQDVVTLVFRSDGERVIVPASSEIIAAARMALTDPDTVDLANSLTTLAVKVRMIEGQLDRLAEVAGIVKRGRDVGAMHLQLQQPIGIVQPRTAVGTADPATCRHTSPERHPIDRDLYWCGACATVLYPVASTSDTEAHEDVPGDVAP